MMGGSGAHEYMAPCPAGENDVALAPGYSANLEIATADPRPVAPPAAWRAGARRRPALTTIEAVAGGLGVHAGDLLKAFPVVTGGGELVLVFVRGDHRVNEIKLTNALGEPFRPATRGRAAVGRPGSSARARTCAALDAAIARAP